MDYASDPKNGIYRIVSFTVTGSVRSDDVSGPRGVRQITLTPCYECRKRMVTDKILTTSEDHEKDPEDGIIRPQGTEVYTMDADHEWRQKPQKVGDLPTFHRELPAHYAELAGENGT